MSEIPNDLKIKKTRKNVFSPKRKYFSQLNSPRVKQDLNKDRK